VTLAELEISRDRNPGAPLALRFGLYSGVPSGTGRSRTMATRRSFGGRRSVQQSQTAPEFRRDGSGLYSGVVSCTGRFVFAKNNATGGRWPRRSLRR
jgi:hypothetical protein